MQTVLKRRIWQSAVAVLPSGLAYSRKANQLKLCFLTEILCEVFNLGKVT